MKLATFFSFVIVTVQIGRSQTNLYHPFVNEACEWSILSGIYSKEAEDTSYGIQKYFNYGDTIIDGVSYIYFSGGFLRDDTLNKKVYYREFFADTETLVYDFSLGVGDLVNNFEDIDDYILFGYIDSAYIGSIDSVFIGDNYRKRFNIIYSPPDELNDSSFWWIEGIGSEHGPLGTSAWYFKPYIKKLICYIEQSDLLYSDLQTWYSCDSVLNDLPIDIVDESRENTLEIVPNPFRTESSIHWEKDNFNPTINLTIINMLGQIMRRDLIPNTGNFLVNSYFPTGQYYCIISDSNTILNSSFIIF